MGYFDINFDRFQGDSPGEDFCEECGRELNARGLCSYCINFDPDFERDVRMEFDDER